MLNFQFLIEIHMKFVKIMCLLILLLGSGGSLLLHVDFVSCGKLGLPLGAMSRLLFAIVHLVEKALDVQASVVAALGLSSCGLWALERGLRVGAWA